LTAAAAGAPLEAFFVSTGVVARGEVGDKPLLLSLLLAARFRKPWPIIAGIAVATLANHALVRWAPGSRPGSTLSCCASRWGSCSSPWRCGC
jgi:putative Ca2+/H+ antiporter (TMEM165/GDT1 family)